MFAAQCLHPGVTYCNFIAGRFPVLSRIAQ